MRKIKFNMPKKYDRMIHASVLVLIVLGTLMVASTSVGQTISGGSANNRVVVVTIIKQVMFILVSYGVMVFMANTFIMEKVMRIIRPIGFLILILLVACFFFSSAGGARSWIRLSIPAIGQITLQPSEFMKVFMIVVMACIVERTRRRNLDCWSIIKIPLSFYAIAAILIFFQNDTGTLIVISLICAICLLIPSHPNLRKLQKTVSILLIVGCVGIVFLASDLGMSLLEKLPIKAHIIDRFEMAANPWLDEYDKGNQLINSLYAFASGGWSGLGFGQSIQKMAYLSAATTDFILAVVVEELGICGFLLILGGYGIIIYRLFKYALMSKREGYKILYIGTAMYLFVHFVLNVGGVTGLIPLTGIPLLFISSGASSLVSVCAAIGICQGALARENRERLEG